MARVKGALATRKRRKRVLKLAKGYRGAKSRCFRTAKQAVMKSLVYAYIGRKQKKREFRQLWITRISAAAKINGINYYFLSSEEFRTEFKERDAEKTFDQIANLVTTVRKPGIEWNFLNLIKGIYKKIYSQHHT